MTEPSIYGIYGASGCGRGVTPMLEEQFRNQDNIQIVLSTIAVQTALSTASTLWHMMMSSAVIKQGTPDKPLVIGAGATVGMGAVVIKDVAPGATAIGNPARPLVN